MWVGSCLWHSPRFSTLPSALSGILFLQVSSFVILQLLAQTHWGQSCPPFSLRCSKQVWPHFGAGRREFWQGECGVPWPPLTPLCRDTEFLAAASPVNSPSLPDTGLWKPRGAQTHHKRQPMPPRPAESPSEGTSGALPVTPRASSLTPGRAVVLCLWIKKATGLPQIWAPLITPALALPVFSVHRMTKEKSLCALSLLDKAPGPKQSALFLPHTNSPSNPIHTSRV